MYLVIFTLIVLFIWYKIRWWRQMEYIDKIPGPPNFFISILGNIHQLWGSTEHLWNKLRVFGKEYYPIYRLWVFEEAMVTIRHPDDAEVPTISRTLSEDVQLGGCMVPKGTTVNLVIYDLHRDPNFWPNPHNYDPDRFLPEKIRNRHPYSYVPFSAGSRNCIGQKFAMLELKSGVRFSGTCGSVEGQFMLEPAEGYD